MVVLMFWQFLSGNRILVVFMMYVGRKFWIFISFSLASDTEACAKLNLPLIRLTLNKIFVKLYYLDFNFFLWLCWFLYNFCHGLCRQELFNICQFISNLWQRSMCQIKLWLNYVMLIPSFFVVGLMFFFLKIWLSSWCM